MHMFAPFFYLTPGILIEFCQVESHKYLNILQLGIFQIKTHRSKC